MLEIPNPDLFRLSDDHIELSNGQLRKYNPKLVSGAMTLSSAKFAAWLCAHASQTPEEMQAKREASVRFFTDEFRDAFTKDYDQYIQEHAAFKAQPKSPS